MQVSLIYRSRRHTGSQRRSCSHAGIVAIQDLYPFRYRCYTGPVDIQARNAGPAAIQVSLLYRSRRHAGLAVQVS